MSNTLEKKVQPRARLMFIDMARSIAILLMLEGHFIDSTLAHEFRDLNNPVFAVWKAIRGFTAPLFFTVSGLVFVYLLTNFNEKGFFKNRRVKKGFKRVLELIFWGYFLQLNIFEIPQYLQGRFFRWDTAFHVLQCIGISIMTLLLLYGLYKLLKRTIPLWFIYFVCATGIWFYYPYFKAIPDAYFEVYPEFVQNMFVKPYAVFCVVPWVGFALYGGMLGSLINILYKHTKKWWFPITFILTGIVLSFFGKDLFLFVDNHVVTLFSDYDLNLVQTDWIFGRLGQVLMVLGLLMIIEKLATIKQSLFIKIGQNTLSIFILHFIILYGGVFGFGIGNAYSKSLDPYTAIVGAALFIVLFVFFIKYLDLFSRIYARFLYWISWPFRAFWDVISPDKKYRELD